MTDLDKGSSMPLHMQAEMRLRNLITEEKYLKGELLPNEVEMAENFGISRNTLRQAINKLVYEGLLVRKKGVGTKVAKKGIVGGAHNWLSFSEEMKRLGVEIRNYEFHVSFKKVPSYVADFFNLKDKNQKLLCMERVRGKKEYPFVYFISYFNPIIPMTGSEDFSRPLYDILEKDYGIVVKTSNEHISARLAEDEELADKLEIDTTDPILIRRRAVYDTTDRPVEFNVGYYRADSFVYTVESTR